MFESNSLDIPGPTQKHDVSCACLGLVFLHLSMYVCYVCVCVVCVCVCVCVALFLGRMVKVDEVRLTRLFGYLTQVVISGFVL